MPLLYPDPQQPNPLMGYPDPRTQRALEFAHHISQPAVQGPPVFSWQDLANAGLSMAPGSGDYLAAKDSVNQGNAAAQAFRQGHYMDAAQKLGGSFAAGLGALPLIGGVMRGANKMGKIADLGKWADAWKTGVNPIDAYWKAADAAGLDLKVSGSAHSSSKYLEAMDPISGELFMLRIADHPQSGHALALHGPADMEIPKADHQSMIDAFKAMIERVNKSRAQYGDPPITF